MYHCDCNNMKSTCQQYQIVFHQYCFDIRHIDSDRIFQVLIYHIEHPNRYRIGIYEYDNELEALEKINKYFVELSGGISRPVTEFYEVKEKLAFKEFNAYINSLKESL